MNKFKFYFFLLIASVSLFSCSKKDDSEPIEPPRDFTVQYNTDIADIEDYLKTNYITVVNHSGFVDDQDVTISKIDAGQPSIMSYLNAASYPKLLIRTVKMHDIEYKLYYLVLRPGVGISPCSVDGVLTSYKGTYLNRSAATATPPSVLSATLFEEVKYPQTYFELYTIYAVPLRAWSEIFPQFKTGTSDINPDGTVSNKDFGAGVMFIPSGLAYYNSGSGSIPAYAPLVFSFKLYNIERLDQDKDGVFSYQEDLNNDGYVYDFRNTIAYPTPPTTNLDDTDKDGIPDFLDVDDDGDNYSTKLEITKPDGTNSGLSLYFPYNPIVDDPLTTVVETETKGIPEYSAAGTPDYTTPGRKRIHVDKDHHTAKP
jgi:hypothetical protein